VIGGCQLFGMIAALSLRLLYLIFLQVLRLVQLIGRTCGCPKLGSRPLTCCFSADGSPA
jgi:hypothetical protein